MTTKTNPTEEMFTCSYCGKVLPVSELDYETPELATSKEDMICISCSDDIRVTNAEMYDDRMDGDFDSAMTSAGMGTDEDYGYFGGDEF